MKTVHEITLNSGYRMPVLGMGTATYPVPSAEIVESSVLIAIELGYRHFDTASLYKSEAPLGRAISEALRRGILTSRDEIFVTTKLWCGHAHPDLVLPAIHNSLKALGLDYVDLYLIHFPARINKTEMSFEVKKEDLLPLDMKGTWQAMEECCRLGLAKSIGVSNFSSKKLSEILGFATIPPAVNQVEMHPLWQQRKLTEFCTDKNIHASAYSPLGGRGVLWGSNIVFDSEQIKYIAQAKGKSIAQICLRWGFEQGVSIIPKSFNKDRLRENMEIFDWELSKEEVEKISLLPQNRIFTGEYLVSPTGPFRSVDELWDGEI
ncbi:3''-deamino-3''-oxonicotianamine reductase [Ranunculus cassubicifolius]